MVVSIESTRFSFQLSWLTNQAHAFLVLIISAIKDYCKLKLRSRMSIICLIIMMMNHHDDHKLYVHQENVAIKPERKQSRQQSNQDCHVIPLQCVATLYTHTRQVA